jgi:hypothetical protein
MAQIWVVRIQSINLLPYPPMVSPARQHRAGSDSAAPRKRGKRRGGVDEQLGRVSASIATTDWGRGRGAAEMAERVMAKITVDEIAAAMLEVFKKDIMAFHPEWDRDMGRLYKLVEQDYPDLHKKVWVEALRIAVPQSSKYIELREQLERFSPGEAKPN